MRAPGKVNLCLYLGPTRALDGRHELLTVFQALDLADELDLVYGVDADEVICPGVSGPNLVTRALELLREAGWSAPPVRVTIDKRIPVAAGMGGGSSDAAAVLSLAKAELPVLDLARRLGADVAALVEPGLWLGLGAGDDLVGYPAGLAEQGYVIVPSPAGLSTAEVYREADRLGLSRSLTELEALAPRVRQGLLDGGVFPPELVVNDLQVAALSLAPAIQDALDALADCGAAQAIVSGSGPTSVGIWWGDGAVQSAEKAANALSARFPGTTAAVPYASSSQFDLRA